MIFHKPGKGRILLQAIFIVIAQLISLMFFSSNHPLWKPSPPPSVPGDTWLVLQPRPCSASGHHPLGCGRATPCDRARLWGIRFPLRQHGSEQLESWLLIADFPDTEWGWSTPTLTEGLRGGSSKTLWSVKPIMPGILASITTSLEARLASVLTTWFCLLLQPCTASLLLVPSVIFPLYHMEPLYRGKHTSYLQLHSLTETWLSPWTQLASCSCSFPHITHAPGEVVGHWAFPPQCSQILSFLYQSRTNLAPGKPSTIWICFRLHP